MKLRSGLLATPGLASASREAVPHQRLWDALPLSGSDYLGGVERTA